MGAIDFGIIVDATVIMVENIFRHLSEVGHAESRPLRPTPAGLDGKLATIFHASTEVTQAIFFSATIIIAGFLPLFTLSGVEGHIFGPMARTYAYALTGGLLATFTVSPALAALLLPETASRHAETWAVRKLRPVLRPCSRHRAGVAPRHPRRRPRAAVALAGLRRQYDRPGVPAQARRRQHVDPCRHAGIDLAGGRQRLRQPHAQA